MKNNLSFWFNTLDYFSSLLNDYDANLDVLSIDPSEIQNFIFDWSRVYANPNVTILVTFDNGNTESFDFDPNIIMAVEQIEDVFRQVSIKEKALTILSPLRDRTKTKHYVKIWEGYPFDVCYTKPIQAGTNPVTTLKNTRTGVTTPAFNSPYDINRLVISSGLENTTITDWLPIPVGESSIEFDKNNILEINKVDTICGTYIRFINQYGTPSYWLFNQREEAINTKSLGNISNDFYNVSDSIRQNTSLGRSSTPVITLNYEGLEARDMNILKGLLESPRISIYTGERFAPNPDGLNWIDVTLNNKNAVVSNFKNKVPNGQITLNMPSRYTLKL